MASLTVALSGAAGYIASHVAVSLFEQGYDVVGFDNFSNSSPVSIDRVGEITEADMKFERLDLHDTAGITSFLSTHNVDAVIHFAGLKAVGESTDQPLRYHENNVGGSLSLLRAMEAASVHKLVFSSSATVYHPSEASPLTESASLGPINPYGNTKYLVEKIIADVAENSPLNAVNLRYFNPVGAHPSGLIGEDPVGPPNNLMPFIMQVAVGRRDQLQIFGDDYDTPDGTCIRDYIHVCDLAEGHVAAVEALAKQPGVGGAGGIHGVETINLGTGIGSSVIEVLNAAEKAVDKPIPHTIVGRRAGDGAISYADPSRARELLNWQATRSLAEACVDHWRWQERNPSGFGTAANSNEAVIDD